MERAKDTGGDEHREGRPLRVLVAEDDWTNRFYVQKILEKHGCEVRVAGNGREALDTLLDGPCDLVLLDMNMPVLDGEAAVRTIRTDPAFNALKSIPVIAVTAHAMAGDDQRFLEAGVDAYLAKPVPVSDLLGAIRGCLKRPDLFGGSPLS